MVVINLDRASHNVEDVAETAYHEALHVTQNIAEFVGTKFDHETEAYLCGYVGMCIVKAYKDVMSLEAEKPKKRKK